MSSTMKLHASPYAPSTSASEMPGRSYRLLLPHRHSQWYLCSPRLDYPRLRPSDISTVKPFCVHPSTPTYLFLEKPVSSSLKVLLAIRVDPSCLLLSRAICILSVFESDVVSSTRPATGINYMSGIMLRTIICPLFAEYSKCKIYTYSIIWGYIEA